MNFIKRYLFATALFLLTSTLGCEDTLSEPFCWDETVYENYTIKYEVTGSASSVSLTIENSDGGTSQFSDKPLPWTYTFTSKFDTWIYCSAQNQGDAGTVTVKLYVNNEVFKQSTSEGAYVIATASGTVNGDNYSNIVEHCE